MKTKIAILSFFLKEILMKTKIAILLLPFLLVFTFAFAEEPQYGGTITFLDGYGAAWPPTGWDPATGIWTVGIWIEPYLETLIAADYVKYGPRGTNDSSFFITQGTPLDMLAGRLAESWTLPDANTIIYKLRKGIMWNEVPGVMASRELTAEDVVYSYKRNIGLETDWKAYQIMESMTATDKYTVEIKLESYLADWWLWFGYATWAAAGIYPPELVAAGANDWKNHRGIGTGPFMLEDYVEGSSITYVRNPDYWDSPTTITGFDKKYEIPFIDRMVKTLIQDKSTQVAALRTGKIDVMDNVAHKYVQSLQETNPEIEFTGKVEERAWRIGMRLDREPFDDIRVRYRSTSRY